MANKLYEESNIRDIANAIRNKSGSSDTYKVSEMANAILNIPSGGGTTPTTVKDVNFYDYDGTLVNSYTKTEFLELSALPSNPTHSGLTSQGWNWALAEAKSYVTSYDKLDIGQMYTTDDGATRIYIELHDGRLKPTCGFGVNGTVTIDWGDGYTDTVTGTDISLTQNTQHAYQSEGAYIIKLIPDINTTLSILGDYYGSYLLWDNISKTNSSNRAYQNSIKKVEIGNSINIGTYAFQNCSSLSNIIIPSSVTNIGTYAFSYCSSLSSITIPSSVTSIGTNTFSRCYSLSNIILSNSVTSIGNGAFQYCYSLSSITIPSSVTSLVGSVFTYCSSLSSITIPNKVTSIGTYAFQNCSSLASVTISSSVTSIGSYVFQYCSSLSSITIPNKVTSIGTYAFDNCPSLSSITIPNKVTSIQNNVFSYSYSISYYDFSQYNTIPTLSNTNAFSGILSDCKIIVPDNLYSDWITRSNWSTYASYIIKKSDWDASQS